MSESRRGSERLRTFGGVFTPSILTILGLILFLRIGFVVGNDGVFEALAILVLEGSVRIEIKGASTLELKQGDIIFLPKGAETLWHVTAPFEEFWIMA